MGIKEKTFNISWSAIFKILLTLFISYIFYLTRDILAWIIFSSIVAILFEPLISFLEKKKIPRSVAAFLIYSTFLVLLVSFLYWVLPIFVAEIKQLIKLFPQYFEQLSPPLKEVSVQALMNVKSFTGSVQEWLTEISSNILKAIVSIFGGIFSVITIFTLSVFFSIEKDDIKRLVSLLIPDEKEEYFFNLWSRCQLRTSAWFSARVLSGLFVGIASYGVLSFFDVQYSFALSVFAGLTDFIPIIGPFFAGLVFGLLALLDSWTKALLIVVCFTIIQQVEANIVMPVSSKKMIGLPATLTLITLLVGGKLWGVLGAVLSLPLVGIIYELIKDLLKNKKYV